MLLKIFNKIKSHKFLYRNPFKKWNLIIYDDLFPHPSSGFRYEEYKQILFSIDCSRIYTDAKSYSILNTDKKLHSAHLQSFLWKNKRIQNNRVAIFKGCININARLFYCIFLNNIYDIVTVLEKHSIPFVFTLYPGGGFEMNEEGKKKLKRVFSSLMFRKVIVTQKITQKYLIENNLCALENIELIFGVVCPQGTILKGPMQKLYFQSGKATLDISFCAAKYMPNGYDKGYDLFIKTAEMLASRYEFVRFHIIGGFAKEDIDVSRLEGKIMFYGYKPYDDLRNIFLNIDLIISPNRPNVLGKGLFDGFPLGAVVEAALSEVVPLVSDELNQNLIFKHRSDIIVIENNLNNIVNAVESFIKEPQNLPIMGQSARKKFASIYSNEFQMGKRLEVLKTFL